MRSRSSIPPAAAVVAGSLVVAVSVIAQSGSRTATTVAAIRNHPGFYNGRPVLVRAELRETETRPQLVSGDSSIPLITRDPLPREGTYDVRGDVLDIGRLTADDPRLSGLDLRPFGVEEQWPRSGEVVLLRPRGFQPAEPFPAPSIRALVLDPERYESQRVTLAGQFRGRNLFGDLPQAPAAAAESRSEFVLRSADAALWVLGRRPRGRGFSMDPNSRIDTKRWLEVSGIVRQARGLVWIDAQDLKEVAPQKEEAILESPPPPPAPVPPEVLFSAPTQDETDVPSGTTVRIQFSRDLDVQTLKGHVRVSYLGEQATERGEAQAPGLQAAIKYDPGRRVMELTFSAPLRRFRTVRVELTDGIRGTDGAPLKPYTLTFSVGGS